MAVPTVQAVKDRARYHLADTEVAGGELFIDTLLQPHVEEAHSLIYQVLSAYDLSFFDQEFHWNIPANWAVLAPSLAHVLNVGEIQEVRERSVEQELAVSTVTPNAATGLCRIQTSTPHGYETGKTVLILPQNAAADAAILGEWVITVVSSDEFDLLGSIATGSPTAGHYLVTSSAEPWPTSPLTPDPDFLEVSIIGGVRRAYSWRGDVFRFQPTDQARQWKVAYQPSAIAPTDDAQKIGFDDGLALYATLTAALAAAGQGAERLSGTLFTRAIGSASGQMPENPGGYLGTFIDLAVRAMQKNTYQKQRFREKRNTQPYPTGILYR